MRFSFRVWHSGEGLMIPNCNQGFEGDVFNWRDQGQPVMIMQGTGLKDRNGVEIYEGDIVRWGKHSGETEDAAIQWNPNNCRFVWRNSFGFDEAEAKSFMEIVGNIYETPQL